MRADSAREFLRMIDASDSNHGIRQMYESDKRRLFERAWNDVRIHNDYGNFQEEFARDDKITEYMIDHYCDNKDAYLRAILDLGYLECPRELERLSVYEIKERLTPKSFSNYAFKVDGSNFQWSSAIVELRKKLDMSQSNRYDEEVARRVYEEVKNNLPKRQGYLASEENPDLLFSSSFREYVVGINPEIWRLLDLEYEKLSEEGAKIWNELQEKADKLLSEQEYLDKHYESEETYRFSGGEDLGIWNGNILLHYKVDLTVKFRCRMDIVGERDRKITYIRITVSNWFPDMPFAALQQVTAEIVKICIGNNEDWVLDRWSDTAMISPSYGDTISKEWYPENWYVPDNKMNGKIVIVFGLDYIAEKAWTDRIQREIYFP